MNLGERICRLRTEAGLSQSDLAEALEVSRQSVSKWETNGSIPDLDKLVKLAELFHITLDELIKGKAPESPAGEASRDGTQEAPQDGMAPGQGTAPPPCGPGRTAAQTAGVVLLSITAVAAILLVVLFGLAGLIFIIPTLTSGLICLFARKHPGLKCAWVLFLLMDLYMCYATGIRASQIVLTPHWTYEMNYARLAFAWVLFLAIVALVAGTAIVLRRDGWQSGRKQKSLTIAAAVVFVLLSIPLQLNYNSLAPYFWLMNVMLLLLNWAKLWCITVLSVSLARWCHTRKAEKSRA